MATYDVTAQTRRVQFNGNGTAGPFAFTFQINATDEIKVLVDKSLSKVQYRIMDQLKCHPLEALARKVDNKIIVSLGANQGLKKGKVGIISPNGNDMNMNDWIVVTVKNTNDDFSEIEPLNPSNKNDTIEGKFIKFLK